MTVACGPSGPRIFLVSCPSKPRVRSANLQSECPLNNLSGRRVCSPVALVLFLPCFPSHPSLLLIYTKTGVWNFSFKNQSATAGRRVCWWRSGRGSTNSASLKVCEVVSETAESIQMCVCKAKAGPSCTYTTFRWGGSQLCSASQWSTVKEGLIIHGPTTLELSP